MAKATKAISQPNEEAEKALNSLLEAGVTYVEVRGKKWKSAPLYNGTLRKMTDVVLNEKREDAVSTKCAALFRLNGFFAIHLWYWILWRWMYYVKEYRHDELLPYIDECKKKVGLETYVYCTILLTGMKDSTMAMTRAEVERFRLEQAMAVPGHSVKNTQSSSQTDTSSSE